jgi:hypothetical protein
LLAGFVGENGDFPFALGKYDAAGETGDAGTDYGCATLHTRSLPNLASLGNASGLAFKIGAVFDRRLLYIGRPEPDWRRKQRLLGLSIQQQHGGAI